MLRKARRFATLSTWTIASLVTPEFRQTNQATRQQIDELKAAGCTGVFEDFISGASTERAGLDACLDTLKRLMKCDGSKPMPG